ncbi:MAG TPA: peptidase M4 [Thermoanaerobaculia bacterium]|nr:peptidase M4 [Thermoanaerobaculia bacterium]
MATSTRRTRVPAGPPIPIITPPPPPMPAVSAKTTTDSPLVRETPPLENPPAYRALRIYAFDPSRGRRLGNYMVARVKYEPLADGMKGAQLHVIDFDASNDIYYKPIPINAPALLVEGGLEPSESDPRFHQQMVYAVAMRTIAVFERALGRDIHYSFDDGKCNVLRVFPHAMNEPNAFYSRELGALLFGYFRASEDDAGTGLPGGTVFTCLSHDIIAHETTHSIIDTIRSGFMDASNPDVPAFHEAFADIVALFQHFSFEHVVSDTLRRTGGVLHRFDLKPRGATNSDPKKTVFIVGEMPEDNPLLDLARQFGESMGRRAALRSALGIPPDPCALKNATEPHDRGAVLVAAVFDAFFSCFMERTADIMQVARAAAGGSGELHPDVINRLAHEVARTAEHFSTMCIRALDYCPPVDITFGEFLRALITSDTELYRTDAHDYREALIHAFSARGILPENVLSLAEESLIWNAPEPGTPSVPELAFNIVDPLQNQKENRDLVEYVVRAKPYHFGLCVERTHTAVTCDCVVEAGVVHAVHAVLRAGDQRPQVEFIAHIVRSVALDPDFPDQKFSGGSTVVFDACGTPKFVIVKRLSSHDRRDKQKRRASDGMNLSPLSNYTMQTGAAMALASIHRGA